MESWEEKVREWQLPGKSEIREWSWRACGGSRRGFVCELAAFAMQLQENCSTELMSRCIVKVCGATATTGNGPLEIGANSGGWLAITVSTKIKSFGYPLFAIGCCQFVVDDTLESRIKVSFVPTLSVSMLLVAVFISVVSVANRCFHCSYHQRGEYSCMMAGQASGVIDGGGRANTSSKGAKLVLLCGWDVWYVVIYRFTMPSMQLTFVQNRSKLFPDVGKMPSRRTVQKNLMCGECNDNILGCSPTKKHCLRNFWKVARYHQYCGVTIVWYNKWTKDVDTDVC